MPQTHTFEPTVYHVAIGSWEPVLYPTPSHHIAVRPSVHAAPNWSKRLARCDRVIPKTLRHDPQLARN